MIEGNLDINLSGQNRLQGRIRLLPIDQRHRQLLVRQGRTHIWHTAERRVTATLVITPPRQVPGRGIGDTLHHPRVRATSGSFSIMIERREKFLPMRGKLLGATHTTSSKQHRHRHAQTPRITMPSLIIKDANNMHSRHLPLRQGQRKESEEGPETRHRWQHVSLSCGKPMATRPMANTFGAEHNGTALAAAMGLHPQITEVTCAQVHTLIWRDTQ